MRSTPASRPGRSRGTVIVGISVAVAIGAGQLVGCAPQPVPSPTPAFANEEEAFAAAEEVYRAYNDALNARLEGAQEPDPQAFLTGPALEADIDAQRSLDEWGVRASGTTNLSSLRGVKSEFDEQIAVVTLYVCNDVSDVRVLDSTGQDVTPPERGDVVSQVVTFTGNSTQLLIADESSAEEASC